MTSKLKIRIGDVEIDYEGTEAFLKEELPALLRTAMELHKAAEQDDKKAPANKEKPARTGGQILAATTATIAARLKVDSGPDLLLAAAAQLTLVTQKERFSRQELLTEMQTASAYYRKSYSNNLTKYLTGAIADGKLQETATNVYALSATTRSEMEGKLADL